MNGAQSFSKADAEASLMPETQGMLNYVTQQKTKTMHSYIYFVLV